MKKLVSGSLIERKGWYYVLLRYYVDDVRLTDTKKTGISVKEHRKREAERMMEEMVKEKTDALEDRKKTTLSHSFADCIEKWGVYKSQQIESTTSEGYTHRIKLIADYARKHDFQIETVTAKDILAFYEWALKYGRRNVPKSGDTSLSRRTVRDVAMIVKAFLNDAVVQGIISINPADKVSVPRVKKNNTKEIAYMELDEAKRFLAFVKSDELFKILYYISKLGFIYGMRRSELLGLRWSTFDFERMGFEVNHTVVRVSTTTEHRDNTKTESSHRYYPITNDAYKCLMELQAWQKEQGIYKKDGYIFLWSDGREYDPDYITKLFKKAVTRCPNVPHDVTLHGLRHSCCAILFQQGYDLAQVQAWLGHSDIAVTANIYNHVSKKWKNEQGRKFDGLFQ